MTAAAQPRQTASERDWNFSPTERRRIVSDIIHWKAELEYDTTWDAFDEYVTELRALPDGQLKARWETTVGEWVASRDDLPRPLGIDFDQYLAVQFGKLIAGHSTDYGFITSLDMEAYYE